MKHSLGKDPVFSGRLGYALNEWIAPYRSKKAGQRSSIEDVEEFDSVTVVMNEVRHVLKQQTKGLSDDKKKEFLGLCCKYLKHLKEIDRARVVEDFPMLFSVANFLLRKEE